MLLFHNDYNQLCHPAILEKLQANMGRPTAGYGTDEICANAANLIRMSCGDDTLDVHFLVGGTQTNLTVIDACLRPHQGVISADTGHIHVHETGAVEATGHKVLAVPTKDGKLDAATVDRMVIDHYRDEAAEHIVQPKVVYISNPTELGTIYSKKELMDLYAVCQKHGLYLFMDGARLGYGLTAPGNDLTIADVAAYTDVFYVGGTKVGAMFGEAVVISEPSIAADFRYLIKQHGGMLAKGWLLGLQFEALFENGLYFEIAAHANRMADKLRKCLAELGYSLYIEGVTNQVFPVLPEKVLAKLDGLATYSTQAQVDAEHRAVRFCTSWATTEADIQALCALLEVFSQ